MVILVLAALGILNLHSAASASYGFALHITQAVWAFIGIVIMSVMTMLDYRVFERWAYIVYGGVVVLLGLVLVVGTELNGAQRWLNLGFFMMQPSELMKVAVILFTARYFHDRDLGVAYGLRELAIPFGIVGFGVAFILKQPDLGTSLVILAIFMSMVLFEGMRWSSILALVLAGLVSLPLVWSFGMHEYQRDRVVSFLDLEQDDLGQSWQVRQSIIAFGSGRLAGKGFVEGTQIQKGFVPEHENDFVAANWGEEHGFLGMMMLLGLYMALISLALRTAVQARDRFGAQVAVGVAAMVFWHVFVNVGMVTGLLPVVGLTLPLMSAGGSSLLTLYFALGLLLCVAARRRTFAR